MAAIEEHRTELQGDNAQRQLLQHGRRNRGMLAREPQLRFNQFFPGVQILFDFTRQNLAELRVYPAHV